MFSFQIFYRNIVSTVNLGCKLDLKTIALRARNAEYNSSFSLSLCIFTLKASQFISLKKKMATWHGFSGICKLNAFLPFTRRSPDILCL